MSEVAIYDILGIIEIMIYHSWAQDTKPRSIEGTHPNRISNVRNAHNPNEV